MPLRWPFMWARVGRDTCSLTHCDVMEGDWNLNAHQQRAKEITVRPYNSMLALKQAKMYLLSEKTEVVGGTGRRVRGGQSCIV